MNTQADQLQDLMEFFKTSAAELADAEAVNTMTKTAEVTVLKPARAKKTADASPPDEKEFVRF